METNFRKLLMMTVIKITKLWPKQLDALGRCLLFLDDCESGIVAFEELITRTSDGIPHPACCDLCDSNELITGSRFVCNTCPDTDLCANCISKYLNSSILSRCLEHKFTEIKSREGERSTPTFVNDQGLTFSDWLKNIGVKYRDELFKLESGFHNESNTSYIVELNATAKEI